MNAKNSRAMITLKSILKITLGVGGIALLVGCGEPEVGSDEWCKNLKDKPKGDWTMNEASDFAKHCVFK